MRRATAALLALLTSTAHAAEADKTLLLPRSLQAGEVAVIQVQIGILARGQEIHVTTTSGRELGVISPFGVRPGQTAGTYPIPVPADAIVGRQLVVHISVTESGAPPHAPTAQEVRRIDVAVVGTAEGPPDVKEKK